MIVIQRKIPVGIVLGAAVLFALLTVVLKGQYCLPIFAGAGSDAWRGFDPYVMREGRPDLFKYAPVWAILFMPLSGLPDWLGPAFWSLLNAIAFWMGCEIYRRRLGLTSWEPYSLRELVLLFPLCLANGFYGQINSLLWLLIAVALSGMRGIAGSIGGVSLTLAAWMKLFPAALLVLARPASRGFWISAATGVLAGVLLPTLFWGSAAGEVFGSWISVLSNDGARPHHKLGFLALLVQAGVPEGLAMRVSGVSAILAGIAILFAPLRREHREALLVTSFLAFSHMTEPPTLALLAPAVLVACRARESTLAIWPLIGLLFVLPSDLTPNAIRELLGGQYLIKTLGILYAGGLLFWMGLIREPGRTRSPG